MPALQPSTASIFTAVDLATTPVRDVNRALTSALRDFAATAPFNQSVAISMRLGPCARSARHFVVSLSTALNIADQSPALSVGNWAAPSALASGESSMPRRYSGSELSDIVACKTRLRVFWHIQCFIGRPSEWANSVPIQSGRSLRARPAPQCRQRGFFSVANAASALSSRIGARRLGSMCTDLPSSSTSASVFPVLRFASSRAVLDVLFASCWLASFGPGR